MTIQRRYSTGRRSATSVNELFTTDLVFTAHLALAIFLLNRSIYHLPPLVHYPLSHSRLLMSNVTHLCMGTSPSTSPNEHASRVPSARISPVPHTSAVLTQIQVVF